MRIKKTHCCDAHSTFDEFGELYCKRCFEPVPFGEGDGSVVLDDDHVPAPVAVGHIQQAVL